MHALARFARRLLAMSWREPALKPTRELAQLTAPSLELARLTNANGYEIAALTPVVTAWTEAP